METLRNLLAAALALFAVAPAVPPIEAYRADTAAMVCYAALADSKDNAAEGPIVRCLVFSYQGCAPCETLKKKIEKELIPIGWKVGTKATDDFEWVDVYDRKDPRVAKFQKGRRWECPTLALVDDKGKELARYVGDFRTATQVADWIKSHRR